MTPVEGKGRVGLRLRNRLVRHVLFVVLATVGATLGLVSAAKAGSMAVSRPHDQIPGDIQLYPFLMGDGVSRNQPEVGGSRGTMMRNGFGGDGAFDGSESSLPDALTDSVSAGHFLRIRTTTKDAPGARFALQHTAGEAGAEGAAADSTTVTGQGTSGGAASVPLPAAAFLAAPGLVLAGYAVRRLRRKP